MIPHDIVLAKMRLGLLTREALVAAAVDALTAGCDSPSQRLLAGLDPSDAAEVDAAAGRSLDELGLTLPSPEAAAMRLAQRIAQDVVDGRTPPYDGAQAIWRITQLTEAGRVPELNPFTYAASEWEDRPADRPFFDEAIRAEAKALVARRWRPPA